MDGEAAGALEPVLVVGTCERLQEGEAVARGSVAEAVAFLVAVGARPPDQLGARKQEVLVEVVPGAGEDAGRARAPLETGDLPTWRPRPVGQAVLPDRVASEDSCGRGAERVVGLETTQGQRVARSAVERPHAAVIVVLPPETVLSAPAAQGCGRLACRLFPTRLAGPLAHSQGREQRPRCAPHDVVGRIADVGPEERVKIVRERGAGGEPEGDEQWPGLAG